MTNNDLGPLTNLLPMVEEHPPRKEVDVQPGKPTNNSSPRSRSQSENVLSPHVSRLWMASTHVADQQTATIPLDIIKVL